MSTRLTVVTSDPILTHGLRGRTWVIGAVLGFLVGMGVYFATPATYTGTAVVRLNEMSPVIDLSPVAARPKVVTVDTDTQIVASDPVVQSVAKVTGDTPAQVRSSLTVTARQLTRVVELSYRDPSAAKASAGAKEAAAAFLDERERLLVKPVEDYLALVNEHTTTPTNADVLATDDISTEAQTRVESWRERAIDAELQIDGAGRIINKARITSSGERGPFFVPTITGWSLGALVGVLVATARRRRPVRATVPPRPPAAVTRELVGR